MLGDPVGLVDPFGHSSYSVSISRWILGIIATDTATPDPSDVAVPKWVAYGIASAIAGGVIYFARNKTVITDKTNIGSISNTPRNNCSKSYHRYLQNQVNLFCKPNPGNCRVGDSYDTMIFKLKRHESCANARRKINKTCFNGGDRNHQYEYTFRRQQAEMCKGLIPTCSQ